jgi:hypothetical protein
MDDPGMTGSGLGVDRDESVARVLMNFDDGYPSSPKNRFVRSISTKVVKFNVGPALLPDLLAL